MNIIEIMSTQPPLYRIISHATCTTWMCLMFYMPGVVDGLNFLCSNYILAYIDLVLADRLLRSRFVFFILFNVHTDL